MVGIKIALPVFRMYILLFGSLRGFLLLASALLSL